LKAHVVEVRRVHWQIRYTFEVHQKRKSRVLLGFSGSLAAGYLHRGIFREGLLREQGLQQHEEV